jgi:chromosomal replication initiator protein
MLPPHVEEETSGSTAFIPHGDSVSDIWRAVGKHLSSSLPESTYRMWLAPLEPVGRRGGTLFLQAPESVRAWAEKRYSDLILHAVTRVESSITAISFADLPRDEVETGRPTGDCTPNPTHRFDRFVIGPGNHLAHAAALAVAEAPSEAYNPLFLHGAPGLGKTHLLGSIANYLQQNVPELVVRYTSAEAFTSEFVTSLKENGTAEFKRRYRNLDVLLIDDIQFIAGKPHTEEEFFHTFNVLYESGSQIVLSADRMPTEITTLTDRLSDRFEWGLTAEITSPNLATRLAVLRHLVTEAGLEVVDQEALTLLAQRVETNLRQLHGALTRSVAEASLRSSPLDTSLIARVFPERTSDAVHATPERIRAITADHFKTDIETLVSRRRDRRTSTARNIAMFLTREMTDLSYPQIAALYGGRDHSTVISSIDRVSGQVSVDPEVTAAVDSLRATLHTPVAEGQ